MSVYFISDTQRIEKFTDGGNLLIQKHCLIYIRKFRNRKIYFMYRKRNNRKSPKTLYLFGNSAGLISLANLRDKICENN